MAEGNPKSPTNPNNQLSDSNTSDEEPINPILKTSGGKTLWYNTRLGTSHSSSSLVIQGHKQTILWREDPAIQKQLNSC